MFREKLSRRYRMLTEGQRKMVAQDSLVIIVLQKHQFESYPCTKIPSQELRKPCERS
jgi:hypothetical protein